MQGTWKEHKAFYAKDCRRKGAKRKHTIRDKGKSLLKKFFYKNIDNETLYNEANKFVFIKPEQIIKQSIWVDIYSVRVESFKPEWTFKQRKMYYYGNWWYDFDTGKGLFYRYHQTVLKIRQKIGLKEIKADKLNLINEYVPEPYSKEYLFLYGKPLLSWDTVYGIQSISSRRQFALNQANRKDRRFAKHYCKFGDWSGSCIKTHSSSKSIAWDVR